MSKYIMKPVVVEAFKWTGNKKQRYPKWFMKSVKEGIIKFLSDNIGNVSMIICRLEGEQIINIGDYVVKGIDGDIHSCKPNIFKQLYEEV